MCSILLRGKSERELRVAKRILRYAILMLYTNRLEIALMSSFGTKLIHRFPDCVVCQLNRNEEDPEPVCFLFVFSILYQNYY